jgi:hypothetical protein
LSYLGLLSCRVHKEFITDKINSKFQYLNSKQIQISKLQTINE